MKHWTQATENDDHRMRAARTLIIHLRDNDEDPENVTDFEIFALIADLLHVARSLGWDPFNVLEHAMSHFAWEVAHEDPEVPREIVGAEKILAAARARIESDPIRILASSE
jgi:hypothetical protein